MLALVMMMKDASIAGSAGAMLIQSLNFLEFPPLPKV